MATRVLLEHVRHVCPPELEIELLVLAPEEIVALADVEGEEGVVALELNGARSNPQGGVELVGLGALHDELLRKALIDPCEPRPAPAKVSPVLETVTLVLERAEEPMRAREIHAAAEQLAGEPLRWTSVKSALSAGVAGEKPHFRRVRHGVYQLARDVRRCTG